nr:type IV secretion system protein virB10 [Brucella melitensis]
MVAGSAPPLRVPRWAWLGPVAGLVVLVVLVVAGVAA